MKTHPGIELWGSFLPGYEVFEEIVRSLNFTLVAYRYLPLLGTLPSTVRLISKEQSA